MVTWIVASVKLTNTFFIKNAQELSKIKSEEIESNQQPRRPAVETQMVTIVGSSQLTGNCATRCQCRSNIASLLLPFFTSSNSARAPLIARKNWESISAERL